MFVIFSYFNTNKLGNCSVELFRRYSCHFTITIFIMNGVLKIQLGLFISIFIWYNMNEYSYSLFFRLINLSIKKNFIRNIWNSEQTNYNKPYNWCTQLENSRAVLIPSFRNASITNKIHNWHLRWLKLMTIFLKDTDNMTSIWHSMLYAFFSCVWVFVFRYLPMHACVVKMDFDLHWTRKREQKVVSK